jgi:hypothetical protein
MGRGLTFIACLAFITSLTFESKADPIPADVTLTVEPSGMPMTGIPYVYSGTIPDVNTPPSYISLSGATLGSPGPNFQGLIDIGIRTTFNMMITFDGASGSHPSIDVTGNVTGYFDVTGIPMSSPYWAGGFNLLSSLSVQGTATSAILQGWTPASGIPMSLIDQYLNPSSYTFTEQGSGMGMATSQLNGGAFLALNIPEGAEVPEPATLLIYLAAISGLVVRRGARLWRSCTPVGRVDGDN